MGGGVTEHSRKLNIKADSNSNSIFKSKENPVMKTFSFDRSKTLVVFF